MRPLLAAATVAVAALAAAGTAAGGATKYAAFRMPSGNIGCAYSSFEGSPPFLRCDILSGLRGAPPKPRSCENDWGMSIGMGRKGPARLLCIGDTVFDPGARVLRYGTTWRLNGFRCVSRTSGLTCTNVSGRGFFVSRQSWRRF